MHTYSSCITLAEGHFRLNTPPDEPLSAQKKARRSGRAISACLELALRPRQSGQGNRRDRQFFCGALLAVLLHMLCFGLLMAHAYYRNWENPGVMSAQGSKDGTPGILLGRISLSALEPPGARTSFAQEQQSAPPPAAQALQAAPEPQAAPPPAPQEPPTAETTASSPPAPEAIPAITPKPARPAQKRQPPPSPRATAGTSTAEQRKPALSLPPQGGTSAVGGTAQTSGQAASSADSGAAGIAGSGGGAEAPGGLAVFGGSEGPSFKRFVKPEYPAQARRQGITGQVLLRIHLNSKGAVERVEVVKSAHDLLSKAALEAARRSSFHPLRRNGQPVSCLTLLPISFSLERT